MRAYSLDDVHATRKRRDSWWTVFLVDPVACRLTLLVANHTAVTPNGLTRFSLILGMCSAICFALGQLAAGALLFYVSFAVDCMDGKIARLKGTGTAFGLWLDYVGDRIRVVCCAAGLASGQYEATGDVAYILLGAGVAVLDLFRYVNAPQMKRVREVVKENRLMRLAQIEAPRRDEASERAEPAAYTAVYAAEAARAGAAAHVRPIAHARSAVRAGAGAGAGADLAGTGVIPGRVEPLIPRAARRPRLPRKLGRLLARHRVRSHLISGIEFHAAVFVVAPLVGRAALVPVAVAAGVLLLLNEVFLIYRMWLFARVASVVPLPQEAPRVSV
ncbi:CDP-alcohol phosphatidyltransferase family protein [Streptosporangium becharense]|nr:CDP-alcohol phosphatidyltransferase family protein [Streptosporangium becharense]